MTEDTVLLAAVAAVWLALAGLYGFVPMFAMPGAAFVWGSGSAVFAALTLAAALSSRRPERFPLNKTGE